jgi:hypothetical protein
MFFGVKPLHIPNQNIFWIHEEAGPPEATTEAAYVSVAAARNMSSTVPMKSSLIICTWASESPLLEQFEVGFEIP